MKERRRITAITFDVGGTLIEPWPSVGHVYAEVAAQWGLAAATEALNRGFAEAWQARRPFDHSRAAWQRLVNQTFLAANAVSAVRGVLRRYLSALRRSLGLARV